MDMSDQLHTAAALPPDKRCIRDKVNLQSQIGYGCATEKSLPLPGIILKT